MAPERRDADLRRSAALLTRAGLAALRSGGPAKLSVARKPFRWSRHSTIISLLMIVVLCGGVAGLMCHQRDAALQEGRRALAATGAAIAEQTLRAVQSVDLVLQDVYQQVSAAAAAGPLGASATLSGRSFTTSLQERLRNLPQLDVLSVVDTAGRVVAFSRSWPPPPILLQDRDYFRYLRDHDDAASFVSLPVQNRGSGVWVFYLARRVDAPDHRFMGLVLAALPVAYFEDIFRRVSNGREGSISLVRREGLLLARYPPVPEKLGHPWPPPLEWRDVMARGGGQVLIPDNAFVPASILTVHPLPLYPLVIDVTVSQAQVLASWRGSALVIAAGTLTAALGLAFLARRVALQFEALERQSVDLAVTAAALRRSQRLAQENAQRLETTLAHMDEGLIMVDATGQVVVCNDRALALLDLPRTLMAGQPGFEAVLRAGRIPDRPEVREWMRPDGRILEVRSMPLQAGGMVRTYTDITARHAAEALVRHQATHDDLTGLANRALFASELHAALEIAVRSSRGVALLYLDLDRFKAVNDTRGHSVGDKLLQAVARRLGEQARASDTVARLGGDEFAILQTLVDAPAAAATLAQRLVAAVAQPYEIEGAVSEIGTSIGIALFPTDALSAEDLLVCADTALYAAKRRGRNSFCFYADVAAQSHALPGG